VGDVEGAWAQRRDGDIEDDEDHDDKDDDDERGDDDDERGDDDRDDDNLPSDVDEQLDDVDADHAIGDREIEVPREQPSVMSDEVARAHLRLANGDVLPAGATGVHVAYLIHEQELPTTLVSRVVEAIAAADKSVAGMLLELEKAELEHRKSRAQWPAPALTILPSRSWRACATDRRNIFRRPT